MKRLLQVSYLKFIILYNEPTNAQLIDKLLYCSYMFRHYCVILRELVGSALLSYVIKSMQSLVIQILPGILISSCSKTNQMHQFLKFIFGIKLHMFWTEESPKHLEFYSKNKFERLVHLVGFIVGSW